jgi:hypothetical protein
MAATDRSDAELLQALGNAPKGIETVDRRAEFPQARVKHFFECSCGYRSAARATFKEAVSTGVHHMRVEARKARAKGSHVNGGVSLRGNALSAG